MPAARRTTCVLSTSRRSSPLSTASRTCPATPGACRWRRSAARPTTGISTSAATWTTRRHPSRTTCARICWAVCLWPRCRQSGRSSTRWASTSRMPSPHGRTTPPISTSRPRLLTAPRSALSWKTMPVCRPAPRLYAMPWRHGGMPTRRVWPTCPHGATSTPCALSFSIPSSPRSRRWACSIASSSRASSPPGGPTRCPTSRRCSKTVSRRH